MYIISYINCNKIDDIININDIYVQHDLVSYYQFFLVIYVKKCVNVYTSVCFLLCSFIVSPRMLELVLIH